MSAFHVQPPELKGDMQFCSDDHFVTDIVVCSMHDVETMFWGNNDLVGTMQIFSPKFA